MLNRREQLEIEELKQRYKAVLETGELNPHGYEICPEDYYDYMIHVISKTYGIPKSEAEKYHETDYIRLVMFNNLEILRNESIIKSNTGENKF